MDNLLDNLSVTGDIEAPNALKPQKPASMSRAGPIRRSATDRTRQRAQNGALARDTDQHKSAPASAMGRMEAAVTKSAEVTKRVALAGACVIGLALLLQNYQPARIALQELFELAPHIKQVTAGTLAVVFDESTVGSAVMVELDKDSPHAKDPTYLGTLTEIIQSLKPDHYKRLMYVDQLRNLCKYERQSVDVDYDFSLDRELKDKGLVKLTDSPALLKEVNEKLGSQQSGTIEPSLGNPQFCYTMSLTDRGYDAKTAFVKTMIKYVKTASH
jgi:hypothetical protein